MAWKEFERLQCSRGTFDPVKFRKAIVGSRYVYSCTHS